MGTKRPRSWIINSNALCRECRRPFFQWEEEDECPRCVLERFTGLRREQRVSLDILSRKEASPRCSVGSLLWEITNFSDLTGEHNVTGVNSVRSEAFMTNQYGYKLCIQLDVFFNIIENRKDVFLRPVIMRGNYDATRPWPFKEKITFTFINQNDLQNAVSLSYQPDNQQSLSFKKPTSDANMASAGIVFPDVQRLHGFLKNGTLILQVKCQTSDIPSPPAEDQVFSYQCQVSEDSE